jgi:hypothetical protein
MDSEGGNTVTTEASTYLDHLDALKTGCRFKRQKKLRQEAGKQKHLGKENLQWHLVLST